MNYHIAFFQWSIMLILELNLIWNLLPLIMLILRFHISINLVLLYCILNFIWICPGIAVAVVLLLLRYFSRFEGIAGCFQLYFYCWIPLGDWKRNSNFVASRKIRLEKLDNTETNHPRNAFNGWLRHPLLKIMKKVSVQVFLKWLVFWAFTSFHLI